VFDERAVRGSRPRDPGVRYALGTRAILICEERVALALGTIAALQGAQLVIVPSASPARGTGMDEEGIRLPASVVRWSASCGHRGQSTVCGWRFASLVGSRAGKASPGLGGREPDG